MLGPSSHSKRASRARKSFIVFTAKHSNRSHSLNRNLIARTSSSFRSSSSLDQFIFSYNCCSKLVASSRLTSPVSRNTMLSLYPYSRSPRNWTLKRTYPKTVSEAGRQLPFIPIRRMSKMNFFGLMLDSVCHVVPKYSMNDLYLGFQGVAMRMVSAVTATTSLAWYAGSVHSETHLKSG